MNYEDFNAFCQSLNATSYVMQWGAAHVWKVGGKVFAIGGWGPDGKTAFIALQVRVKTFYNRDP